MSRSTSSEPPERPSPRNGTEEGTGLRHKLAKALPYLNPFSWPMRLVRMELRQRRLLSLVEELDRTRTVMAADLRSLSDAISAVQGEIEPVRDERVPRLERRLDELENRLQSMDRVLGAGLTRLDGAEAALRTGDQELARLRDGVVPALVARENAVVDRLAEQLEEQAGMLERVLRGEPLPVPVMGSGEEGELARALGHIATQLPDGGERAEPAGGLADVLARLRGHDPVLDLGAGAGALMHELVATGVAVAGLESDPARAAVACRRGLDVEVCPDLAAALESRPAGTYGAAVGLHIVERLSAGATLAVLRQVHRVLRPGGILVLRLLNLANLRVAAGLVWHDARNLRPVAQQTLRTYLVASGFEVQEMAPVEPYPEQEWVARPAEATPSGGPEDRLAGILNRLHALLDGPRALLVSARRGG